MPARLCECDKCGGGKVVSKTTRYRHQKRLWASRCTPCGISTQKDPSLSSVPGLSTGTNLDESGEGDPPDNVGRLARSEKMSTYINLINLLILYRTMKTWRTFGDMGLLYRCPNLIKFLVLCSPHLCGVEDMEDSIMDRLMLDHRGTFDRTIGTPQFFPPHVYFYLKHLIYQECLSDLCWPYNKLCSTVGPWGSFPHMMQLSRWKIAHSLWLLLAL